MTAVVGSVAWYYGAGMILIWFVAVGIMLYGTRRGR